MRVNIIFTILLTISGNNSTFIISSVWDGFGVNKVDLGLFLKKNYPRFEEKNIIPDVKKISFQIWKKNIIPDFWLHEMTKKQGQIVVYKNVS